MFVSDRPYAPLPELRSPPSPLPPRLGDDGVTYDHGYAVVSLNPDGPARADYFGVGIRTGLLHSEVLGTGRA